MPLIALIVLLQADVRADSEPVPVAGRVLGTLGATLAGSAFSGIAGGGAWLATTQQSCSGVCGVQIALSSSVFALGQIGLTPFLAWQAHRSLGGKGSYGSALLGGSIASFMDWASSIA